MGSECIENIVTTTLSLIVHQERYITEQFTVELVTAKQSRYSTTKFTNRLAFVIFACVKLCISGQWMQLEYGHNCQSRVFHQIRYRAGQFIYSWVLCCKTSTVQYQIMKQLSSCLHNNFSRAPHGLQFLHLVVQNTHGRVPTVWQLFSCKSVRFCAVNALRICTQLPESLCPSSEIQNWTVYIWLSLLLQDKPRTIPTKHKQNATVEFMIADQFQYDTSWFTVFLVLQQNTHGTAPAGFALAAFACITVRLWAVNALRIWPQLHSHW